MNNRKNQNSLLVLATLGVYLGLVLAGATPQVLAQAAMTRQFDVKDEFEIKDDLDKKPDNLVAELGQSEPSEIDSKITQSVERFFAKFSNLDSISLLGISSEINIETQFRKLHIAATSQCYELNERIPLRHILTISNLPRAGLDSLLATDAK